MLMLCLDMNKWLGSGVQVAMQFNYHLITIIIYWWSSTDLVSFKKKLLKSNRTKWARAQRVNPRLTKLFLKKSKFRYQISEYQNFTGFFLLIQKENGNSNIFCKFQHHSMQIFFKMANQSFLKTENAATTPSPSDFDGLPYPRVRRYPQFFFFMKMTAKDVQEITNMPLVTFFSVLERPGKNSKGGCSNPSWLDEG